MLCPRQKEIYNYFIASRLCLFSFTSSFLPFLLLLLEFIIKDTCSALLYPRHRSGANSDARLSEVHRDDDRVLSLLFGNLLEGLQATDLQRDITSFESLGRFQETLRRLWRR